MQLTTSLLSEIWWKRNLIAKKSYSIAFSWWTCDINFRPGTFHGTTKMNYLEVEKDFTDISPAKAAVSNMEKKFTSQSSASLILWTLIGVTIGSLSKSVESLLNLSENIVSTFNLIRCLFFLVFPVFGEYFPASHKYMLLVLHS